MTWDERNIEARPICGVSGHKSEETIRCYSRQCPPKKKREMADIISDKLGNPAKKAKTIQEYEKEQAEKIMQNANFQDWVPIENNVDDFDVASILKEIENTTNNYDITVPNQQNQNQVAMPSTTQALVPQNAGENVPVPSTSSAQNSVVNVNSVQNYPVIPKMFFPHSNVTINYNFNNTNKQ